MADEAKAKGNAAFSAGRFEEASKHAIALAPVLYSSPSAALASIHRYSDALADAEKTVELKPEWAKGYSRFGAAHLGLGDAVSAVAAYEKGLALGHGNEALKGGLADAKKAADAPPQRSPSGANATGQMFQGPELWSNVAQSSSPSPPPLQQKQEQPETKAREAEAEPQPEPMEVSDEEERKERKAAAQKEKEAAKDFEMAIDDEDFSYLANGAAIYIEMGKFDECTEDCDKAVERGRKLHADHRMVARALTREGTAVAKLAKNSKDEYIAIETYQKALKEHWNPDTLKRLNEAEKAKQDLQQQEYYDPKSADEEREKGNGMLKQQHYPEAIKHYSEALKTNPKDVTTYSNRAACYTKCQEDLQEKQTYSNRAACYTKCQEDLQEKHLQEKQYNECIKEPDKAVERGSEIHADYKMVARAPKPMKVLWLVCCLLMIFMLPCIDARQLAQVSQCSDHNLLSRRIAAACMPLQPPPICCELLISALDSKGCLCKLMNDGTEADNFLSNYMSCGGKQPVFDEESKSCSSLSNEPAPAPTEARTAAPPPPKKAAPTPPKSLENAPPPPKALENARPPAPTLTPEAAEVALMPSKSKRDVTLHWLLVVLLVLVLIVLIVGPLMCFAHKLKKSRDAGTAAPQAPQSELTDRMAMPRQTGTSNQYVDGATSDKAPFLGRLTKGRLNTLRSRGVGEPYVQRVKKFVSD